MVDITGDETDETITGGAGADSLVGGGGSDTIDGAGGNDTIFGDGSLEGGREGFFWSLAPNFADEANAAGFTQNTGQANVTFSIVSSNSTNIQFETGNTFVDGINTDDGNAADNNSALEFETNAGTDAAEINLAFDQNARDVSFRISDIDRNMAITVTALDSNNNPVVINFDPGASLSVAGNTVTGGNGAIGPNAATGSVLIEIPGPLTEISIEIDAAGNTSNPQITDLFFGVGEPAVAGDDVITGGDGDDVVLGEGGNDSISGDAGADSLDGGDGDDTLEGGIGDDLAVGGADNDLIRGDDGADTLIGDGGDDTIEGGDGADVLVGDLQPGVEAVSGQNGVPNDPPAGQDDLNYNTGATADQAANLIFAGGFTINNASFIGANAQTAIYTGGDAKSPNVTPGEHGLILSTGRANQFNDENETNQELDNEFGGGSSDAQVNTLTNDGTFETAALVVDFTADRSGSARMDLTYLTDEFPEFLNQNVSDIGAVFLDSNDGNGFQLVPLTGTSSGFAEVDSLPNQPFLDNGETGDNETFNTDFNAIQNLSAPMEFVAGQDYTIKIVIADVGDEFLDSALLVAANSIQFEQNGPSGNDVIDGGAGDDTIEGNEGDDALTGGDGDDSISGGIGDDTLRGGAGDTLTGGDGDDLFTIDPGEAGAGSTVEVVGGEGAETGGDTLDLTLIAQGLSAAERTQLDDDIQTIIDANDPADNAGGFSGSLTAGGMTVNFSEIEAFDTTVICFAAGTLIDTEHGERPVEDVQVGERVITRDRGAQAVRWANKRTILATEMRQNPKVTPVIIHKGALGAGLPSRDLTVSPQHRMLVSSKVAGRMFGASEILVAAKHLIGMDGIEIAQEADVTYVHFACDQHEIIFANGAPSETLFPGKQALRSMNAEARAELFAIFPELMDGADAARPLPARTLITGRQGRNLTKRIVKNRRTLLDATTLQERRAVGVRESVSDIQRNRDMFLLHHE